IGWLHSSQCTAVWRVEWSRNRGWVDSKQVVMVITKLLRRRMVGHQDDVGAARGQCTLPPPRVHVHTVMPSRRGDADLRPGHGKRGALQHLEDLDLLLNQGQQKLASQDIGNRVETVSEAGTDVLGSK